MGKTNLNIWTYPNDNVLTLVGWRGWTAEGNVWPVAVMAGSGLGLEMELEQLKPKKNYLSLNFLKIKKKKGKKTIMVFNQDSPGGPEMFPKGMDPVICRACWAAGGIFRPVPVEGKRLNLNIYIQSYNVT